MMNGVDVDQRVDFTYDAWGNRVAKTVDIDGPSGSPYVPPTETTQYPSYVIGKSSEYTATDWSAMQATGAPDVSSHGDNVNAWAAYDPDNAEYLSLGLTTPMYVQDVTIRESYNVGFVTKVELIKMDNSRVQIWAGTDPSTGTSIVNFTVYVRDGNGDPIETDYLVKGIKIYIDGTHVLEDWEEIDSVAVHGTLPEIEANNLEPVTMQFTIDGWNPAKGPAIGLENFDVWAEDDGSSLTTYLRGERVDELLGRSITVGITTDRAWFLTDKLGSINTIIDITGAILDKIDYDAFGNIISETHSENRGSYGFTSRYFDPLTGLQENRGRWYSPEIAGFMQKDPIGFLAGDPNLRRYVFNSPTNATDPSGNFIFTAVAIGIAVAGGGGWLGYEMHSANVSSGRGYGQMLREDVGPGIAQGAVNTAVETANRAREIAYNDLDVLNSSLAYLSNERWGYRGYLGQTGQALNSGHLTPEDFYTNAALNLATFGAYDEVDAFHGYLTGRISADEASRRLGGGGTFQLAGAGLMRATCPAANQPITIRSFADLWADDGGVGRPIPVSNPPGTYRPNTPLPQQRVNGVDIPIPDPLAGGNPHTTLGTRIGSDGVPYLQSATFPGGPTWPLANGQNVPWSRVDWTSHARAWDHPNPHQHFFIWNSIRRTWVTGPQTPFDP